MFYIQYNIVYKFMQEVLQVCCAILRAGDKSNSAAKANAAAKIIPRTLL